MVRLYSSLMFTVAIPKLARSRWMALALLVNLGFV
jgi:hypothetical protein